MKDGNVLVKKSFQFAKDIITLGDDLRNDKNYIIANQIVKSGTSIGANIREAQNSESLADFIHKLKIAVKEAEETEYWLELIEAVYDKYKVSTHLSDLTQILKILNAAISTSKRKK